MQSSSEEQQELGGRGGAADKRGKLRILAELKRVEQELKFLEDELEELEKTENASTVCQVLLQNVGSFPDPLLPETNGPANLIWDRWFEGPEDSQSCRCQIL